MFTLKNLAIVVILGAVIALPGNAREDQNAAIQYLLAVFANGFSVPAYVDSATTVDPLLGFLALLTLEQNDFLQREATVTALARFDKASSLIVCEWGRFEADSWEFGARNPIFGLHQLSRTVMLRARRHYERGDWIQGNRDVENTLLLVRRMVSLCRPHEHQLFMIENIANGTAAANLLNIPPDGLADLSFRLDRVGVFFPMKQMMHDESKRLSKIEKLALNSKMDRAEIMSRLIPYFADRDMQTTFEILSPTDQSNAVLGIAEMLSRSSNAISIDLKRADEEFVKICDQALPSSRYFSIDQDYFKTELRENAQAFCRGTIFRSVIARLIAGDADFSTIDDPFGDDHLLLLTNGTQKKLVSKLRHDSQIDFTFVDSGKR